MKNMKVLLVAIAVLSLPLAFPKRAFSQSAPEVDGIDPNPIYDGDTNVSMTISGSNFLNSDGSCGGVAWWTDASSTAESPGYSGDAGFTVTSCDTEGGTWISGYYSVSYPAGSGFIALGTFVVQTDSGIGYGPDVDIDDPDE